MFIPILFQLKKKKNKGRGRKPACLTLRARWDRGKVPQELEAPATLPGWSPNAHTENSERSWRAVPPGDHWKQSGKPGQPTAMLGQP